MDVFVYDVLDELAVAKFPEDFADWLMDEGREADALEFLARWRHYESITPEGELDFDDVIDLAHAYADVVEVNTELRGPVSASFAEAFALLRATEATDEPYSDDAPLTWDREAQVVNQALADQGDYIVPLDLDEHEFPEIKVYVEKGCSIMDVLTGTILALAAENLRSVVNSFCQDLLALTREPTSNEELFALAWSYVDIKAKPAARRRVKVGTL
jgi:hypothetical protein